MYQFVNQQYKLKTYTEVATTLFIMESKALLSIKSRGSSDSKKGPKSSEKRKPNKVSIITIPELHDKENSNAIASSITKEVIEVAFNMIYEQYLERQTVYFVSHCSGLAWKSLIEWEYQCKDEGGFKEADLLDTEPEPSAKDSWAGHSVPIAKPYMAPPAGPTKHEDTEPMWSKAIIQRLVDSIVYMKSKKSVPSPGPSSRPSNERGSKREEEPQKRSAHSSVHTSFRKSFPTIIHTTSNRLDPETRRESKTVDTPVVIKLDGKSCPANRVEVKYSVIPTTKKPTDKKPKFRTIVLSKPTTVIKGGEECTTVTNK